jgi:hypothetical protein
MVSDSVKKNKRTKLVRFMTKVRNAYKQPVENQRDTKGTPRVAAAGGGKYVMS